MKKKKNNNNNNEQNRSNRKVRYFLFGFALSNLNATWLRISINRMRYEIDKRRVIKTFVGYLTQRHHETIAFSLKFVFSQFTSSLFYVSFLSRVKMNSTNPACSQFMGLHSSVGRALQRWRRGHGFESRRSPEIYFGLICNCLNCSHHCDDHIFN